MQTDYSKLKVKFEIPRNYEKKGFYYHAILHHTLIAHVK